MITLERITLENLDLAISVHEEIFPDYSAKKNYMDSIDENSCYEYYLLKANNAIIGTIGIYSYPEYPENAWLGWFGIREPYRRMRYGTQAIKVFEEIAIKKGFSFVRLYTDKFDNDVAISFYKSNAYIDEDYYNKDDLACEKYPIIIFSKSITEQPLSPWDNRNIHLTEQIEKQMRCEEI